MSKIALNVSVSKLMYPLVWSVSLNNISKLKTCWTEDFSNKTYQWHATFVSFFKYLIFHVWIAALIPLQITGSNYLYLVYIYENAHNEHYTFDCGCHWQNTNSWICQVITVFLFFVFFLILEWPEEIWFFSLWIESFKLFVVQGWHFNSVFNCHITWN